MVGGWRDNTPGRILTLYEADLCLIPNTTYCPLSLICNDP